MTKKPLGDWRPTLSEFRYRTNNAGGMSDIHRKNAQRIDDLYSKSLIAQRDRVYDGMADHNQREQEKVKAELARQHDRLVEALERKGGVSSQELLSIVTEVQRIKNRAVEMSEAAAQVEERAWEQADMTPEQFQESALTRFPALKSRLPLITEDAFEGREDPKF